MGEPVADFPDDVPAAERAGLCGQAVRSEQFLHEPVSGGLIDSWGRDLRWGKGPVNASGKGRGNVARLDVTERGSARAAAGCFRAACTLPLHFGLDGGASATEDDFHQVVEIAWSEKSGDRRRSELSEHLPQLLGTEPGCLLGQQRARIRIGQTVERPPGPLVAPPAGDPERRVRHLTNNATWVRPDLVPPSPLPVRLQGGENDGSAVWGGRPSRNDDPPGVRALCLLPLGHRLRKLCLHIVITSAGIGNLPGLRPTRNYLRQDLAALDRRNIEAADMTGGTLATADLASREQQPLCRCGHAESDHDPVAVRYCAATLSSQLIRKCICRPTSPRPS